MQRLMLKSKIHGVTVTGKELSYDGSITLDTRLMEVTDTLPSEQVHVLNLNNGQRFVTYTIPAPAGSGTVVLNGPAARLGETGDSLIVLSYAFYPSPEASGREPVVVRVDAQNRPIPPLSPPKSNS